MEEEAEAGGQQRAPGGRRLQLGGGAGAQLGHPRRPGGGIAGQGGAPARQDTLSDESRRLALRLISKGKTY